MQAQKTTQHYRTIAVHQVNGDIAALEYLANTDYHFVESIFFFAKRFGQSDFNYKGTQYELVRNRNLTYTVRRKLDDADALADAFA